MREVLDDLVRWWEADEAAGMGTVVATWRSAPRPVGAAMLVGPDGSVVGSVSGGCVEGAVYEAARRAVDTGRPSLERYGVSDDDAFAVGLTCGGVLDVYIERVDRATFPELGDVSASIRSGEPVATVTTVGDGCAGAGPSAAAGATAATGTGARASAPPGDRVGRHLVVWTDRVAGTLGSPRLDAAATDDVRGLLATGRSAALHYGHDGERRGDDLTLFVASYSPPPRMIVFGAIDFAAAVARVGAFLGYRVTVCDARPVFATSRRFPEADEVVVEWPHRYLTGERAAGRIDERSVVCVLTHDPKFDVPVLEVALRMPLAYVGAMGSRRTHDDRIARLREAGLTTEELAKLASPIGLDLGARTPEETAVSIGAEIIAARWGGTGGRLGEMAGRIHHEGPA
ncbi:XdhC/CoxI family protein [Actinopolymorpha sp. B17G11]|uniref:XdhC/CoxI family protein n=1 Tax=unclassified Actinopolymorpha TaxID=2627063 RepID=UPI0032D958F0